MKERAHKVENKEQNTIGRRISSENNFSKHEKHNKRFVEIIISED